MAADAVPRVDRFFDEYKLGVGMKQETVLFWLAHYDLQHPGRIDQKREADEFMAYQQRVIEARKRFRTKEYDRAREAYYQTFDEARDNLMATAAPTRQALLVKMEVAALALGDEYLESTLADAQRLLGRGA